MIDLNAKTKSAKAVRIARMVVKNDDEMLGSLDGLDVGDEIDLSVIELHRAELIAAILTWQTASEKLDAFIATLPPAEALYATIRYSMGMMEKVACAEMHISLRTAERIGSRVRVAALKYGKK